MFYIHGYEEVSELGHCRTFIVRKLSSNSCHKTIDYVLNILLTNLFDVCTFIVCNCSHFPRGGG